MPSLERAITLLSDNDSGYLCESSMLICGTRVSGTSLPDAAIRFERGKGVMSIHLHLNDGVALALGFAPAHRRQCLNCRRESAQNAFYHSEPRSSSTAAPHTLPDGRSIRYAALTSPAKSARML